MPTASAGVTRQPQDFATDRQQRRRRRRQRLRHDREPDRLRRSATRSPATTDERDRQRPRRRRRRRHAERRRRQRHAERRRRQRHADRRRRNDSLDGGGIDTASYSGRRRASRGIAQQAHSSASGGDAAGDSSPAIENLIGSAFRHARPTGRRHVTANVLNGGAGNDILHGGAGNDILIGGAGADRSTAAPASTRRAMPTRRQVSRRRRSGFSIAASDTGDAQATRLRHDREPDRLGFDDMLTGDVNGLSVHRQRPRRRRRQRHAERRRRQRHA